MLKKRFRLIGLVVALAVTISCGSTGPAPTTAATPSPAPSVHTITESWVKISEKVDNVDSVAVAENQGWILATTKGTHQLLVLDAETGTELRRVGRPGSADGEFQRPNGIAVVDDVVFVVERDNHRVQVLSLPGFEPLGVIGDEILKRPYGIAAAAAADGGVDLWITDNYDWDRNHPEGRRALSERIRRFHTAIENDTLRWQLTATFGDTTGRGALWKVETIAVDAKRGLLLVAEEETERMALVIYTVDGEFTGQIVGEDQFKGEPEGVGIWETGEKGFWVATDQHDKLSVFHLFDSQSFDHVGAFSGEVTANTDGITVTTTASGAFPSGAVFAVHDDQGVTAFNWQEIDRKVLRNSNN